MLTAANICFAPLIGLLCVLLFGQLVATLTGEDLTKSGLELHERAENAQPLVKRGKVRVDIDVAYEPPFTPLGRSIIGRQDGDSGNTPLQNNVPVTATIAPNQNLFYVFPSSALRASPSTPTVVVPPSKSKRETEDEINHAELKKRQSDVTYYLTLSVCSQPSPSGGTTTAPPPPLQLFLSYTDPQPQSGSNRPMHPAVEDGFSIFSDSTSDNIFIQVQAVDTPGYSGNYSFQLTASIDARYAVVENTSSLLFVDSDSTGAMLITTDLTNPNSDNTSEKDDWRKLSAPFTVAVVNQNLTQMSGLLKSYCAFQNNTQIVGNFAGQNQSNVDIGFTNIGDNALKQQFYVSGLNRSSSYSAVMGLPTNFSNPGSGQPGGGGTIWQAINFTTQSDGNCKVIYNLSFCERVNYAVPYNPNNEEFQGIDLANWYDDLAMKWWTNFSNAIDQVACDTTPDAQYSLAVTCQDCKNSYKQWLCAVTIPRCRDFSSQASYLLPRAINSSFFNSSGTHPASISSDPIFNRTNQQVAAYAQSRNPAIDQTIMPGPYKELLPCGDMCYSLVQTCPASLGFSCPTPFGSNVMQYNMTYGYSQMDGAFPQCNIPGQMLVSTGDTLSPSTFAVILASLAVVLILDLATG